MRRTTLGLVRPQRRGRAGGVELRLLGLLLMRLGSLEGDARPILGGLLVARPGGTLSFPGNGIAVDGYLPRLPRPLYDLQEQLHLEQSRRFLRAAFT